MQQFNHCHTSAFRRFLNYDQSWRKKTVKKQELSANSALVIDLKTNEIIYSNNPDAVKPIASVTKLMTAIVTLDAKLPWMPNCHHHQRRERDERRALSSKDRQ